MRVRFAPSPTGYLHIGGARTVLFNWLLARKHGGTFILRIEDTDQLRHVEDSVQKILDDLRWLGLNWDEGPEVGGEFGPYYQSQRIDTYNHYLRRLLESGQAYYALETQEQLAAMRESAKREKRAVTYVRPSPLPSVKEGEAARAQGRAIAVRLRMPDQDITVTDDILGLVTLPADQNEDFVIQKGDGFPTYHFACVVDDELMKITHVIRGQEHLMNTPKHIALQRALGFATPRYAHLPLIFNMDGSKMSKRDKEKALAAGKRPPEIDVHDFRVAGYLPEAIINFIALLGWSPGEEREFFAVGELGEKFSMERIGKTNARFDREKLLAFNTHWAAELASPLHKGGPRGVSRLLEAFKDYIVVTDSPMRASDNAFLERILHCCAGFRTFRQVEEKVAFLFIADDAIEYDPKAVQKVLEKNSGEGYAVLRALLPVLEALANWTGAELEKLIASFAAQKGLTLGQVAQPLRVTLTGSTISPSIHDTLELLGRGRTLARVQRCLTLC
jgi:glutamyl-tRNA synthetase